MEVYLIRHGIAAERGTYDKDEERPLTAKGIKKTTQVAQRLHQLGLHFDLILTSPLVRATETAGILLEAGLGESLETLPALAPGGQLETWLSWYGESLYNGKISYLALVGHQPDLGNWAETLVWGSSKEKLVLKKAGVIGLNLPTANPIGNSQLFLLTSPRWLL